MNDGLGCADFFSLVQPRTGPSNVCCHELCATAGLRNRGEVEDFGRGRHRFLHQLSSQSAGRTQRSYQAFKPLNDLTNSLFSCQTRRGTKPIELTSEQTCHARFPESLMFCLRDSVREQSIARAGRGGTGGMPHSIGMQDAGSAVKDLRSTTSS